MATQQEIEETYDFIDEMFRLSLGENADMSCAMYNGDFFMTLEQAQQEKHDFILDALHCKAGSRVLDIGCGFGPMLKAVEERGGHAIGLTLSSKQAQVCKRSGFEAYVKDWKDIDFETFGAFDAIISIGAFEHFCSVEEYLAGKQEHIYENFFRLCHELLPAGGRLYLQTMMLGKNAPDYQSISLKSKKGSNEYITALLQKFFPGSWPPLGEGQIVKVAGPYFEQISHNNGRLDYIETMEQWSRVWRFTFSSSSFPKLLAISKLVPQFLTDKEFRRKTELLRRDYDKECFKREILDHQRMVFQKK